MSACVREGVNWVSKAQKNAWIPLLHTNAHLVMHGQRRHHKEVAVVRSAHVIRSVH